ncbi:acyltransferase family protein [Metabacillus arenae]|uniref:Acyltransferase n=1 Tax=Metabacillus arenae TaxID=2771434 RepID=A0A926RVT7_9BACI|nr:acyltransferase [Metabacillus arenae]MBD1379246.1 acyltransferase [Metabacillus arenae]
MEITKNDTNVLKGLAIILMLLLHLFCRKDIEGFYEVFFKINDVPFIYYISLLGDACRPIYLFLTGYAFYIISNKGNLIFKKNIKRIFKLMINFWIVFILFIPLAFIMKKRDIFLNIDIGELILSLLGLSNSYNGAWWFIQIYIIIVLLSPFIIRLVRKFNPLILIFISGVLYFISYLQRYREIIDFGDNEIILKIVAVLFLFGTSQLSFLVGAIFAKEKIYSKIHQKFFNIKHKNIFCIMGICIIIGFHSIVESSIIAPINGVLLVFLFTIMNKSTVVENTLSFLSKHSTNIWLTHMFFYMMIFPELTFAPKYPIFIFIWLFVLSIASSYLINLIYNPIVKLLDKKGEIRLLKDNKVAG